jgi:hypothetical protein
MYISLKDPAEKKKHTQKGMNGKKTFVVALFDVRNVNVVAFRILIEL